MLRGTLTGFAEGVIEAMGGDHEAAAAEGDGYFDGVGGETVAKPGGSADAGEAERHHEEHGPPAVLAETDEQRGSSEERDQKGETAVRSLFGWKEVREDC